MAVQVLSDDFLVNTATASNQLGAQVTALSNGGLVVTWDDYSQGVGGATGDTSGLAVKAQGFAADGTKIGDDLPGAVLHRPRR
jgi:hypothetical protein